MVHPSTSPLVETTRSCYNNDVTLRLKVDLSLCLFPYNDYGLHFRGLVRSYPSINVKYLNFPTRGQELGFLFQKLVARFWAVHS
jgi:hypothetical protein